MAGSAAPMLWSRVTVEEEEGRCTKLESLKVQCVKFGLVCDFYMGKSSICWPVNTLRNVSTCHF